MRLVDHIRFGPFSAAYHRDLVTETYKAHLERFLQTNLVPQLDSPLRELDGRLIATFDNERNCGPNSLVRDNFTLECVLVCDDGTSELKSDIIYNAVEGSFTPRTGYDRYFYVWTPARKRARETEMAAIQRVVDDVERGERNLSPCPLCGGQITAINDADIFDARCTHKGCFVYNFHKDERGRLAHGHFIVTHPQKRAERSSEPAPPDTMGVKS